MTLRLALELSVMTWLLSTYVAIQWIDSWEPLLTRGRVAIWLYRLLTCATCVGQWIAFSLVLWRAQPQSLTDFLFWSLQVNAVSTLVHVWAGKVKHA